MNKVKSENVGKYYRWTNGLRIKVVGINQHNEYKVCDPRNESKKWDSVARNIDEAEEISEMEAKAEYAQIEHNTPQFPLCSCCTWRIGCPNISIKMSLASGRLPTDEANRIEGELEKFFSKLNILSKVSYYGDGIHIEFFDMSEYVNKGKQREKTASIGSSCMNTGQQVNFGSSLKDEDLHVIGK